MDNAKRLIDAQEVIAQLKKVLADYDALKRSPLLALFDLIDTEINKIDIKREEEIEALRRYYLWSRYSLVVITVAQASCIARSNPVRSNFFFK